MFILFGPRGFCPLWDWLWHPCCRPQSPLCRVSCIWCVQLVISTVLLRATNASIVVGDVYSYESCLHQQKCSAILSALDQIEPFGIPILCTNSNGHGPQSTVVQLTSEHALFCATVLFSSLENRSAEYFLEETNWNRGITATKHTVLWGQTYYWNYWCTASKPQMDSSCFCIDSCGTHMSTTPWLLIGLRYRDADQGFKNSDLTIPNYFDVQGRTTTVGVA